MIHTILTSVNEARGSYKKDVLERYKNNEYLKKVLEYTYNHYKQYFIIKVPELNKTPGPRMGEEQSWDEFFDLLDKCDKREISGNNSIKEFQKLFLVVDEDIEYWMRKILERHLNIGISISTIEKVYPGLVSEFKVQLAKKYDSKRIKDKKFIAVEPKLDGFRCIAVLKNGKCVLYSRNGKDISRNFENTICKELEKLYVENKIIDCVLDGELMGLDFKHTSEQVHKKTNPEVKDIKYNVFDYILLDDWIKQKCSLTCQESREKLEDLNFDLFTRYIKTVPREIINPQNIKKFHDLYVSGEYNGSKYEGIMIKILEEPYKFSRSNNLMKYKEFFDLDLECIGFEEGTGKYYEKLGSILVNYDGVTVNVGSGFSDEQREDIWKNRTKYRGMIVEVRAQEITEDKSLRFPTFRAWRYDKTDKYSKIDE